MQEFQQAKTILFYASFDGEVETFEMMKQAKTLGKRIGLPRIIKNEKEIVPAIFILNRERKIRWMQSGRNGWYFGDEELLKEIGLGVFI